MANLGESLMRKIMRKYSIGDGTNSDVIEFENIIALISLFRFHCQYADKNELKFYLFNTGLVEQSLKNHHL